MKKRRYLLIIFMICILYGCNQKETQGEADIVETETTETKQIVMGNPDAEEYDFESLGLTVDRRGSGIYPRAPYEKRLVGLAYTTWHRLDATWHSIWSEPALGRYDSDDLAVIRKHAEWIYDAGVDFIWIDWSNDVTYVHPDMKNERPDFYMIENSTYIIFEEYSKMENSPDISIFIGCPDAPEAARDGRLTAKADQIYNDFVLNEEYNKKLQYYNGKPLLVVYTNTPTVLGVRPRWDDDRFTVRFMTGYPEQQGMAARDLVSKYNYWSWEDRGAQTFTVDPDTGMPEAMVICAATRMQAEPGAAGYIPEIGRRNGITFREQFARAMEIGVKFAMVGTFNEWTTGEQPSIEVSKDIEPSEAHGDFYLRLLKEETAKFKGYEKTPLK